MKKTVNNKRAVSSLLSKGIVLVIICSLMLTACGKGASTAKQQSAAKQEETAQQAENQTGTENTDAATETQTEEAAVNTESTDNTAGAGDAAASQTETAETQQTQTAETPQTAEAAGETEAGAADAAQEQTVETVETEEVVEETPQADTEETVIDNTEEVTQEVVEEDSGENVEEAAQEEAAQEEAAQEEVSHETPYAVAPERNDSVSDEYNNAAELAYKYASEMFMSKQAIYNQLIAEEGEALSADAAQYAVDVLEVDWIANALRKAQDLNDSTYLSKGGLYDWMTNTEIGEGFTAEEAQYAIDHVSANWKNNAYKCAKEYRDYLEETDDVIYNHLISDQFTAEEADYAMSKLN